MLERREEDMKELILVPAKPLILAIPIDDEELKELREDLRVMGCAGLLTRPWNVLAEDTLREFLYERGNQFEGTKRREPERWLRIRGPGFTGLKEVLREDGQNVRVLCLPKTSKGRLIQRRASTRQTA